ncbi:MAG: protein kinase [Acidobacteria bacterium]|nr:protein kinase [Acidobacteriota bacterium]
MPLAAGTKLGPYEILAPLGKGGMGEVYRARDTRLGRDVAIKVLPEHLAGDAQALTRFEREARAVAALSHPNILALYDVGSEHGVSYAVTELLEGETLRSRLEQSPLGPARAIEIGVELAEGISAAHSKGITHRDLKPENIFLTSDGVVKILDFGLARWRPTSPQEQAGASTETETEAGHVLGTIGYMSPEQVRGERADARSDIFSLGCVLYEMFGRERAFARASTADALAAILKETPPPLGEPDVDRLLSHCLEKNPAERFQSSRDLVFALQSLSQAPSRRLSSWFLRLGAAVAVLLVVALAVWLYWRRAPSGPLDSLAVLPFVNVAGGPNLDYLSDGVPEALTNTLSRQPKLRVVPRARAFRYKGAQVDPVKAGRELGVRAVLTGRVTLRGDSLNVQVELVDVHEESQLWGEQYRRRITEIQAVQDEITRAVTEKLRLRPAGETPKRAARNYTENTEAYQLYLKGRYYWDKRTEGMLRKAAEQFQQALEKDPTYALAYAGLAEAYAVFAIYNVTSPAEAVPRAKAAIQETFKLDDTIAEAHTALAFVRMTYDWDLAGAEQEYARAIELNPQHPTARFWHGLYLLARHRDDEAIAELRRAQQAAPLSLNVNSYLGWVLLLARRTDQAIEQFRRALDMDPNFPNAHLFLGMAYEQQGKPEEAIAEIQKAQELSGGNLLMISALGHAYGSAGRRADAERVLAEMAQLGKQRYVAALDVAYVYCGLREKEKSFEWLEKAFQEHSAWLLYIDADPRLDWLRPDPRFAALLKRLGLAS